MKKALLVLGWALTLVLVLRGEARADDLRARISDKLVEVGQVITLHLDASSTTGEVTGVSPGPVPGFRVVGKSLMPTQTVTIVNGVRTDSRGMSATFTLRAERVGIFTLGPATATLGGRSRQTAPVEVHVVPAGQAPRRQDPFDPFKQFFDPPSSPGRSPLDDLLQDNAPTTDPKLALPAPRGAVAFLHAIADKTHAVVGEQVSFTVHLYIEADGRDPHIGDVHEAPASDFIRRPLLENETEARHVGLAKVGGRIYEVKLVRKTALFPLKAGLLPVGAMSLRIFRDAAGRSRPDSLRESESLSVSVTEPPLTRRPAGYALGDVGDFSLKAEVTPREVEQDGAVAITVELSGTGNLPSKLPLPTARGVEWLEPEVSEKLGGDFEDRFGGTRTFRHVVRLHEAGAIDLGELGLPFFSPRSRSYGVARAALGSVVVRPGESKKPVDVVKDDRLPGLPLARTQLEGRGEASPRLTDRPLPWLGLFGFPGAFVLAGAAGRARRALLERRRAREGSPEAELFTRMKAAEQALREGRAPETVQATLGMIEQAALARLGVNLRGVAGDAKGALLEEAGLDPDAAASWVAAIASAEELRYAPVPPTLARAKEELACAKKLIAGLRPSRRAAP